MVFDVENDKDINKNLRVDKTLVRACIRNVQEWIADEKAEVEMLSSSQG